MFCIFNAKFELLIYDLRIQRRLVLNSRLGI